MDAIATTVYVTILYSGLAVIFGWIILSSWGDGRNLTCSMSIEKSSAASDLDEESLLNEDPHFPESAKKDCVANHDWLLIVMKLSEVAYFPSTMIILAFNATAREPIDLLSTEQVG